MLFGLIKGNPYDGIKIPLGDNSINRKYLTPIRSPKGLYNKFVLSIFMINIYNVFLLKFSAKAFVVLTILVNSCYQ